MFIFRREVAEYHQWVTIRCESSNLSGFLGPYPYLVHASEDPFWVITY